ncbi:MAG: polysaccharide pyruvyl transferase family protein [Candidatus Wildermuthbacteria bacterium]|nr:polysaccharide pyruvyl transferase family protein [Candidatus Wildermuthbacteria bacterium]
MDHPGISPKIIYFGGGWPTNIGNAFIDFGSMQLLRMAVPDASIYFASEMPKWFFASERKDIKLTFDLASVMDADYIVVSGMVFCDEFLRLHGPTISACVKRGAKFVISGGGGAKYTLGEVERFRDFLTKNPPYAFISRDERSFKQYQDLAQYSYNGIDCAFFVSDAFRPARLTLPEFVIYNFDVPKPYVFFKSLGERVFKKQNFFPKLPAVKGTFIIKTHHASWQSRMRWYKLNANTFISDLPEDYLNLYANTKATYSDRVHACVATMAFGKPAMLFSSTPRAGLFERVGVGSITSKLTFLDQEKIRQEKEKQIGFLRGLL